MHTGFWFLGMALSFGAGVVVGFLFLRHRLETAIAGQKEIEARLDEMRADIEVANTEVLVVRAESDLRQEQLRRLLELEDDGQGDEWRGLN